MSSGTKFVAFITRELLSPCRVSGVTSACEQAVKKLKELGFTEEQIFQKKMVSPSHMLKLTSDEDIKARIRELTVHVAGAPVLTEEDDRRTVISAELLKEMYGEEPIDKGAG